ncbi:MAG: hypothetical protein HQL39_19465, partial [Alphaproteobacteria bacterium]|nr:hypothetical protein [Alphaproteobacteria bacterium]
MTFPDAAAPLRAEIETALDLVPLLISAGDLRRINIGLRAGAAALADDGLAPSIRLFQGMVSAHHHMLHESLQAVLGNRVAHGLFAGMELAPGMVGSASLPRLIGSYEDELQPLLAAIVPSHARVV